MRRTRRYTRMANDFCFLNRYFVHHIYNQLGEQQNDEEETKDNSQLFPTKRKREIPSRMMSWEAACSKPCVAILFSIYARVRQANESSSHEADDTEPRAAVACCVREGGDSQVHGVRAGFSSARDGTRTRSGHVTSFSNRFCCTTGRADADG